MLAQAYRAAKRTQLKVLETKFSYLGFRLTGHQFLPTLVGFGDDLLGKLPVLKEGGGGFTLSQS
jgi:hypothetical protein